MTVLPYGDCDRKAAYRRWKNTRKFVKNVRMYRRRLSIISYFFGNDPLPYGLITGKDRWSS